MAPHVNWDDIRIFLEYLRAGSVNAAADRLKVSAPTVSRRINALQTQLGYPLLNRTGQSLELQANAEKLIEIWGEAERLLTYGPELAERMRERQTVELRFSTTPALATALIFPNLPEYLGRWPNLMLDVDTSITTVDIGAGQGDVALRFVEPERGAVVRQRVGQVSFSVYCAARILPDGFEPAQDWQPLAETALRAITWSSGSSVSMPQQKLSEVLSERRSGVSISEFSGLVEAICNGLGAGILPDLIGYRLPGVVPITQPGLVGEMPLWLVTADRLVGYRHISDFREFVRLTVRKETARLNDEMHQP